ncbi:MAG: AmmeMemoRadiSam system protein B [Deltaproteobacteria bacterium]|nr:AmmeMemoRadiSam system protein B [Deltaproteobacteria bacterium]
MIRRADFAGSWYPGTPGECRAAIEGFLENGLPKPAHGILGVGGIVPHAGWYYSGEVAAKVMAVMAALRKPDLICVFGMHLGPSHPNIIMDKGEYETPLGNLSVAEDAAALLVKGFDFLVESPESHSPDNTIELQLPLVRYFFGDVKVLGIGAPPTIRSLAVARAVVDVASHLGYRLSVIGSTDLTHYGPNYGFSPRGQGPGAVKWVKEQNDFAVMNKMMELDAEGVISESLSNHNACCGGAAAAAIAASKSLGAVTAQKIAYTTSLEKGGGSSFVGYAGMVF